MSRILIHMLREPGHLLPTLRLTRALRARGHHVLHLLTPAWLPFAERHRLTPHLHLHDIYPPAPEPACPRLSAPHPHADTAAP
ncbi:MAG TPA: hypothetical protein PKW35_23855, partial [Nannocystaceae bacterium]|nr:hypothetical protein [Nannocystaceae bacterium]